MNTTHQNRTTLFQDRNLEAAGFQPKPTCFSTEIEGEGMEVFLRGFLVACLLAALTICGLRIDASTGGGLPTVADESAAIVTVNPIAAPSICAPKISIF